MDAIVMDGKRLDSGAVSAVRNIANPIQLARLVMDKVRTFKSGMETIQTNNMHFILLENDPLKK